MVHIVNIREDDVTMKKGYFYVDKAPNYGSPLGNPYTANGKRVNYNKLTFTNQEDAVAAYKEYFKVMYGYDKAFTEAFDKIYEMYKTGEDIYLGLLSKPTPCHADIIAEELQKKFLKEKIEERKRMKKEEAQKK